MPRFIQLESECSGVDRYHHYYDEVTVEVVEGEIYSLEYTSENDNYWVTFVCDGYNFCITKKVMQKIYSYDVDLPDVARILYYNKELLKTCIQDYDSDPIVRKPVSCELRCDGSECVHSHCSNLGYPSIIVGAEILDKLVSVPICKSTKSSICKPVI
jgi:hypothetical protein